MKALKYYQIPFTGLKLGEHEFNYSINDDFFALFEAAPIKQGDLSLELLFDKKRETFFELSFHINGSVKTDCDRCLSSFDLPVEGAHKILVKADDSEVESDMDEPDVLYINLTTNHLNIAQVLYELIMVSIPYRKVHPVDEEGNSTCNPEMLKHLDRHLTDEEAEIDPRWQALNELKKKK